MIKKQDLITKELDPSHQKKNEFIVNNKISKVEVHGLDPFCRITTQMVKTLQMNDKSEAIPIYRQEAEQRLIKKIQETKVKKEVVRNENFNEWLEKQKKEAELKAEREREKGVTSPSKKNTTDLFNIKRFSQMHTAGSMIVGIDKLLKKKNDEQDQSSERPMLQPKLEDNVKKAYKKGENIPNLQAIVSKENSKKTSKSKNQSR